MCHLQLLLPILKVLPGILDVRRVAHHFDDRLVEEGEWRGERPQDVEKQHNAMAIRLIPDLVLVSVVEDEALPLFPVDDLIVHANTAGVGGLRNQESEMVADEPFEKPPVGWDVLSWPEN